MAETPDNQTLEWLVRRVDPEARLLGVWPLAGGVSAQVTALEIVLPDGRTRRLVVRQHGAVDRERNPQIAADEFQLLQSLYAAGLPVPQPVYVDAAGEILGTACVVEAYIEGAAEFKPADVGAFIGLIAAQLSRIHRLDTDRLELSFLRDLRQTAAAKVRNRPDALDSSLDEGRIRDRLEAMWPPEPPNQTVLLHGDFWPGNLLWRAGELAGVIDWEDAGYGDPLADLANTRLELFWALGGEAMDEFTRQYRARMPGVDYAGLPTWDLYAALKPMLKLSTWANDEATEEKMRAGHRRFVTQALETTARR